MPSILENIHSPADVKALKREEVVALARECREKIIETVSKNGGHLSSNLGVVELTIALHRVFDSEKDAFIFDVSHQCYTHKLLTGRSPTFDSLRTLGGLSGFQKQGEGPHDFFDNGHASSAISQALGLLCARKILNPKDTNKALAIVGDGALTGGLAFEALSNAGLCNYAKDLIIIVNDNQMSISRNTGAISSYLSRLTMTTHYQAFRRFIDKTVACVPFFGKVFTKAIFRFKRAIKAMFFSNNLFSDLDLEYVGPLDGHDERTLERILRRVAKMNKAVVVHVLTKKGKGYKMAEDFPERFHGVGSFCISDGKMEVVDKVSFTEVFSAALLSQALRNPKVVCISAAMAKGTGLAPFARHFPTRFFDVGIAEEHAVTFAGGLAKGGAIPIVAIYSSFMQRAVDQVIEDVALQGFHVVFVLDRAGPVPFDGETHQGIFDIPLFSCVPRLKILSPATAEDMEVCLDYAINECTLPVIIRLPKTSCPAPIKAFSQKVVEGRGVFVSFEELFKSEGGNKNNITLECAESEKNKEVVIDFEKSKVINNAGSDNVLEYECKSSANDKAALISKDDNGAKKGFDLENKSEKNAVDDVALISEDKKYTDARYIFENEDKKSTENVFTLKSSREQSAIVNTTLVNDKSAKSEHLLCVTTGSLFSEVKEVAKSWGADVYTLRFIESIDEEYFMALASGYKKVVLFEDGVQTGGVSQRLENILRRGGVANIEVRAFPKKFFPQGSRSEILKMAGVIEE